MDRMEWKQKQAKIVLYLGLIGIVAVFLTVVSDLILLGRPVAASAFFQLGTESMAGLEQWRLTAGTFIGVFMLPFQVAGLGSLYFGMRPSGKLLPIVVVLTYAHALTMGIAFHTSYAYIGSGWKLLYRLGSGNSNVAEFMSLFGSYWTLILAIMIIEFVLGTVLFMILILSGKTLYPKWMALSNPLIVMLLTFTLLYFIPAPIGGYIAPAVLNFSTLAFFILSTLVIYRKMNMHSALSLLNARSGV